MAEKTIQVTEWMADFIQWASDKGQEEITKLINDRLKMLKEECALKKGAPDSDGFKWDDALEPNDGNNQWKHGGDCNKCRKVNYCMTKCRPNKLLKQITTPFLYRCYLDENPEAVAKRAAQGITPDQLLEQLGAEGASVDVQPVL